MDAAIRFEAGGYRVAEKLLSLKRRPSAVVLVHEMMAIGFYQRTAEAGVRIGKDMAVIGFRDSPRCDHLSPSLTRFRPKIRDLGLRLGEVLLGEMAGRKKHGRPVCEIWPMELVPGDSG